MRLGDRYMKSDTGSLVDLMKKFEVVNKEVIQMSRRLSEMKTEVSAIKSKMKSSESL